ncbi:MAG TPA: SRPBCC family protein [Vicinamibacterales bacterium]|jgi:uncharacterized protein YndB with AHSA1/START domain
MSPAVSDRIEKHILLRAPLSRVWRAITDATEFGAWFGVTLDAPFTPGARVTGRITPTTADAEVARAQEPHAGKPFEITIERIEPQRLFSFRWHPYAIEPGVDYSGEPMTLIEFALTPVDDGVHLIVTESGFDRIPLDRRATAFTMNEGGWSMMIKVIEKYVAKPTA